MKITRKKGNNKTERLSIRCTSREKKTIERHAEQLGMKVSDYVISILIPGSITRKQQHNRMDILRSCMDIRISMQDLSAKIAEKYQDENVQEELDKIWKMIKSCL